MSRIVLNPTSTAQWHALVGEAQQSLACRLDEELESYLVFLLMRFADRPHMFSRVIALDFLDSQQVAGNERQLRLRDVGDHCLLFSGLFPRLAERRRVRLSYFVDLGRSAYLQISETRNEDTDAHSLFMRLAREFVQLMDVLQSMRSANDDPLSPLQAFELWDDTGSSRSLRQHTDATPAPAASLPDTVPGKGPVTH